MPCYILLHMLLKCYLIGFFFYVVALERSYAICRQADIIAALTLEVLKGSTNAFDVGKLAIIA